MKQIKRKLGERIMFIVFGIIFLIAGLIICLVSIPLLLILVGFFTFPLGALLVVMGYALLKDSKFKTERRSIWRK